MTASAAGSQSLSPLQLMANTVDWSLEDTSLLQIRSRGQFNRTLVPMERGSRLFWEYLNYLLAALALGVIAFVYHRISKIKTRRYQQLISS